MFLIISQDTQYMQYFKMPKNVAAHTTLYELTNVLVRVFIQEAPSLPNGNIIWDCLHSMCLDEDSGKCIE